VFLFSNFILKFYLKVSAANARGITYYCKVCSANIITPSLMTDHPLSLMETNTTCQASLFVQALIAWRFFFRDATAPCCYIVLDRRPAASPTLQVTQPGPSRQGKASISNFRHGPARTWTGGVTVRSAVNHRAYKPRRVFPVRPSTLGTTSSSRLYVQLAFFCICIYITHEASSSSPNKEQQSTAPIS
jgi:hypothetical protein